MKDPGFLSGLIGWVIGFAMGIIVEQIKIVLSFPEQLEKLKNQGIYESFCGQNSTCSPKLEKLLEEVSPMVKSGSAVSRFDIFSRYVMGKRITNLISKIETNEALLFYQIGAAASGNEQTEVEGKLVTLVAPSSLAEDAPAPTPVVSQVASEATPAMSELASEATPAVSEVVEKYSESEVTLDVPATPSAGEEVPLKDGGSGLFSRFKGILEYMNVDVSGRKQLASLEDLTMQIRPTITLLKELQVDSTFDGNGSAVQAWFKRLEQSLDSADDMIKKYKGHFVYDGKSRKTISGLISEINALLKWGQVIIGYECFKN